MHSCGILPENFLDGGKIEKESTSKYGVHLRSQNAVTIRARDVHEYLEYLPYGEVWVEDTAINSNYRTPYKFTGKELDKETGLY